MSREEEIWKIIGEEAEKRIEYRGDQRANEKTFSELMELWRKNRSDTIAMTRILLAEGKIVKRIGRGKNKNKKTYYSLLDIDFP